MVVDKGAPPDIRTCPISDRSAEGCACKVCGRVQGGGGAGLFSDGKLVLDLQSGGHLRDLSLPYLEQDLLDMVEDTLFSYDGESVELYPDKDKITYWNNKFESQDLQLKTYPVRHLGSYNLKNIIIKFIKDLSKKVDFRFFSEVSDIFIKSNNTKLIRIKTNNQETWINTDKLILAVGKFGSNWLHDTLTNLGISFEENRTYIGVRLETSNTNLKGLMELSYDPKIYHTYDDGTKIKTHCFCRNGQVITVNYEGFPQVGGHTKYTEKNFIRNNEQTNSNSNFAILLGDVEGLRYSKQQINQYFSRLSKTTNGKIIVQRLGDFRTLQPTTYKKLEQNKIKSSNIQNIYPGNILDFIFPEDFKNKFLWFLDRLEKTIPGIADCDNLLYAPALEWCMDRVPVDINMETELPGIYAVGDGAGLSQGIVHAAATGILAGRNICSLYTEKKFAYV